MKKVEETVETPQAADLSVTNLPSAMFVATNTPLTEEETKTLRKAIGDKKLIIMSPAGFKTCVNFAFGEMAEYGEQKKLTEFIRDTTNIKQVLEACWKLRNSIGMDWFTMKDLVDNSEMNYKEAKAVLDLVYAFGYMAKKEIDKRDFWILIDDFDSKISYFNAALKELKENVKGVEQILATVILQKQAVEKAEL